MNATKIYLLISCVLLTGCASEKTSNNLVCSSKTCVEVVIANEQRARNIGLMHVKHLPENQGMLFIFSQPAQYSFWMKNTFIPLDIIWIDQDRKIVDISSNTPPCKADPCPNYTPRKEALYVLEINGDLAESKGIRIGEKLEFRLNDI